MVLGGLIANMLFTRMVIRAGYLLLARREPQESRSAATPTPAVPPV